MRAKYNDWKRIGYNVRRRNHETIDSAGNGDTLTPPPLNLDVNVIVLRQSSISREANENGEQNGLKLNLDWPTRLAFLT